MSPLRKRRRPGFSLIEALCSLSLFSLLAYVLFFALQNASALWRRSSSRDTALGQMTRVRDLLSRDLANSSALTQQFYAPVQTGPTFTGFDGDALTFLTADNGNGTWQVNSSGNSVMQAEITYYLYAPSAAMMNANPYGISCSGGTPDSSGYDQQCPLKWLMRRQDPAPAPIAPNPDAAINPAWISWVTRPSSLAQSSTLTIVANQLLGFRVLNTPPTWQIQVSAVAIADATREVAVGSTPLAKARYTMVQQFAVSAHN